MWKKIAMYLGFMQNLHLLGTRQQIKVHVFRLWGSRGASKLWCSGDFEGILCLWTGTTTKKECLQSMTQATQN
jgi:hypothetical protein